jgi:hypothetical protein
MRADLEAWILLSRLAFMLRLGSRWSCLKWPVPQCVVFFGLSGGVVRAPLRWTMNCTGNAERPSTPSELYNASYG